MVAKKRATKKVGKKGKPIAYDGTNFSKIMSHIKDKGIVMINILFHLNGCGPCQRIMGPYKKAVSQAPSNVLNMTVESQQVGKLSDDMKSHLPTSEEFDIKGYPTIIKVNTNGSKVSQEFANPSNVGTLTSSTQGIAAPVTPPLSEGEGPSISKQSLKEASEPMNLDENVIAMNAMNAYEEDSDEEDSDDDMNVGEDSLAGPNSSIPMSQSVMSGGAAYAALAAAAHGMRRRKTGRTIRHRKTGRTIRHRKTGRKTGRTIRHRKTRRSRA